MNRTLSWRDSRALRISILLGALLLPLSAGAVLGGDASTIAVDQQKMPGTLRVSGTQHYTVHEIQGAAATAVREFVSPAGQVFGVAWRGPFMPDLRQLLGSNFDTYIAAMGRRHVKGPVSIELPGLVVHSSGRMRNFFGQAYVPALVPQGVTVEEIR
jgi:Protein of unknown function (DUF2844)